MAMAFTVMNAWAAYIDEPTAREVARNFVAQQAANGRLRAIVLTGGDLTLVYTEMSSVVNKPNYYIYNTTSSYVVVAGDDRIEGVLIYGDAPLDVSNIPCGLQALLDLYKGEIDDLYSHPGTTPVLAAPRITADETDDVAPLLTAMWSQMAPYYNECPVDGNGNRCVTGCCCTSLSMVFYYWKYSNITERLNGYTTRTLGIYVEPLEPDGFDWDNMLDEYWEGCYTQEQGDAVAHLMRYVGQAEYMDYSPEGSGAYDFQIANAVKTFGYDQGVLNLNKGNFTAAQWRSMMINELREGRPFVYTAQDKNGAGGHAFNVDGYDAENGLYHVNFGWGGNGNAYCALNDFSAGGYTFNQMQAMIIGIHPPVVAQPEMAVDTDALTFTTEVGTPVTQSFQVWGDKLAGDITVTLSDANGAYTIDKTVITADEAADCAAVNVTFDPAAAGQCDAVVTVSTEGADNLTVTLSGTATAIEPEPDPQGPPSITTSVDELNFGDCYNGYHEYRSLIITGENLNSDITLSLEGGRAIDFTICGPQVITPEQAAQGVEVTVGSFPYSEGVYRNLYLVISCADLKAIKVPIKGQGIKTGAYIYPDQTEMEFETEVGHPVTMQLGVKKVNFNGWIASYGGTVVDPGEPITPVLLTSILGQIEGDMSIRIKSTQKVPAVDGCDSVVFTIEYNPISLGTHHAQLVLYSLDRSHQAHPVTVEIMGTATGLDYLPGDMDGDGELTLNDIALLSQAITVNDTCLMDLLAADVNDDGTINIQDVIDLIDIVMSYF